MPLSLAYGFFYIPFILNPPPHPTTAQAYEWKRLQWQHAQSLESGEYYNNFSSELLNFKFNCAFPERVRYNFGHTEKIQLVGSGSLHIIHV